VLTDKINRQMKRFWSIDLLEEDMYLARQEDEWEMIVAEKLLDEVQDGEGGVEGLASKVRGSAGLEGGWSQEVKKAEIHIRDALRVEQERAVEHGRRLVEILEKERELWKEEKNERRRAKTGRWPSRGDGGAGSEAAGHAGIKRVPIALEKEIPLSKVTEEKKEARLAKSAPLEKLMQFKSMY
jgi:hypothetical protein